MCRAQSRDGWSISLRSLTWWRRTAQRATASLFACGRALMRCYSGPKLGLAHPPHSHAHTQMRPPVFGLARTGACMAHNRSHARLRSRTPDHGVSFFGAFGRTMASLAAATAAKQSGRACASTTSGRLRVGLHAKCNAHNMRCATCNTRVVQHATCDVRHTSRPCGLSATRLSTTQPRRWPCFGRSQNPPCL